mmetsp:Transcript_39930/g.120705  ORF Transcript_39930/g.120705 Transcript_39930/m.120705 type:complete len:253 (-) Transcript_39930:292-1050(-)
MVFREITGNNTASIASPMFSIKTLMPPEIDASNICTILAWPMRVICNLRSASFCLIHALPCVCGSMIRLQRLLHVMIAPFSSEARSRGNPLAHHLACSASVDKVSRGSGSAPSGTPRSWRKRTNRWVAASRYSRVNTPTYEAKEQATSESPGMSTNSSPVFSTVCSQIAPLAKRASTKRFAMESFVWQRSASAATASFSAMARPYSATRAANRSSRSCTSALTCAMRSSALRNVSVVSRKDLFFGSTCTTTS